ncbi:aldo-keto reductase family protein [Paenibacillus roseipurpureus]|uniref:Uncharacterized protein n=1 Tax=Paenibacillus roseopurpureus TaxID=2918901 RepID=A0AA96LQE9_9BACL|nr:hypothetical protein [Paenibacillus sp. MBLB1832]WNR45254.1 hypothetical protein MJB10_03715 [Paenibacillus sp. MBLB1832]
MWGLLMGILADAPAPFLHNSGSLLDEAERRMKEISFLRNKEPKGLAEPAMRFSLVNPDIHITLTGTTSIRTLKRNAFYCDGIGLGEEEEQRVLSLFTGMPLFP